MFSEGTTADGTQQKRTDPQDVTLQLVPAREDLLGQDRSGEHDAEDQAASSHDRPPTVTVCASALRSAYWVMTRTGRTLGLRT